MPLGADPSGALGGACCPHAMANGPVRLRPPFAARAWVWTARWTTTHLTTGPSPSVTGCRHALRPPPLLPPLACHALAAQHSERPITEPVIVILDPDQVPLLGRGALCCSGVVCVRACVRVSLTHACVQIFLTAQRVNTGRYDPKTMIHWDWNTGLKPECVTPHALLLCGAAAARTLPDEPLRAAATSWTRSRRAWGSHRCFCVACHGSFTRARASPRRQMYGLGAGFLRYNLTDVCGPDSPCRVTSQVRTRLIRSAPAR
jgi:hypothetical protein